MSMVQFITCGAIETVIALIAERPVSPSTIGANILPLIFLGVGSSGIAYTLQILGQNGPDPSAASIIMSLESVFGAIGGAIFLSQMMEIKEYIGCAVVFVAIVIAQLDFFELFKKRLKKPKN